MQLAIRKQSHPFQGVNQGNRVLFVGDTGEDLHHVAVVPPCALSLVCHAELVRLLLLDEVQRKRSDEGEVGGTVSSAVPRVVFAERDIEHPVQAVVDLPVRADDAMCLLRDEVFSAGDVPCSLFADVLGGDVLAPPGDLNERRQPGPAFGVIDKG
ncbi:MAG: hypothetical protein ACI82G_000203 [Bradymonadia bacterium]|jgi:hypothetical protein